MYTLHTVPEMATLSVQNIVSSVYCDNCPFPMWTQSACTPIGPPPPPQYNASQ